MGLNFMKLVPSIVLIAIACGFSGCGLRPAHVELSDWTPIKCTVTDLAGSLKSFTCASSMTITAVDFEASQKFDRAEAEMTAYHGLFLDQGITLFGTSSVSGQSVTLTLSGDGTIEDIHPCVALTDSTGQVTGRLFERLEGGDEQQFGDTLQKVDVSIECL